MIEGKSSVILGSWGIAEDRRGISCTHAVLREKVLLRFCSVSKCKERCTYVFDISPVDIYEVGGRYDDAESARFVPNLWKGGYIICL